MDKLDRFNLCFYYHLCYTFALTTPLYQKFFLENNVILCSACVPEKAPREVCDVSAP